MSNPIEQSFKHQPVNEAKARLTRLLKRKNESRLPGKGRRRLGSREVLPLKPGELPTAGVVFEDAQPLDPKSGGIS